MCDIIYNSIDARRRKISPLSGAKRTNSLFVRNYICKARRKNDERKDTF